MALLALVRALQGVGFSCSSWRASPTSLDIVPPAERGWALGIYGVSGFVSTAVAPLIGEWIVRTAGFRTLFLLSALLAAGAVRARVAAARGAARRRRVRCAWPPARCGRRWRTSCTGTCSLTMFFGLGSGTIFAFLPTFAEDLGVTTLSLFYTAYSVAAIAVRLAGGRLIDTRGRRAVIVPSMFVQALATGLLALLGVLVTRSSATPVLPVLFVAGLLSGGAHGFLYPALAALVTDATPPSPPRRRRRHLQRGVPRRPDGRRLRLRLGRQRARLRLDVGAAHRAAAARRPRLAALPAWREPHALNCAGVARGPRSILAPGSSPESGRGICVP